MVCDQLANAVRDVYRATFELDHGHSDAVDVEDDIGPAFVAALEGDFFSQGEVILLGVIPVNDADAFMRLADSRLDLDAVA